MFSVDAAGRMWYIADRPSYTTTHVSLRHLRKDSTFLKKGLFKQKHKLSDLDLRYLRHKYHKFSLTHLYHYELGTDNFRLLTDSDFFVLEQKENWQNIELSFLLKGNFNLDLKAILSNGKDISNKTERITTPSKLREIFLSLAQKKFFFFFKLQNIGSVKKCTLVQDGFFI